MQRSRLTFLVMALITLSLSCQKARNISGVSVEEWEPDVAFSIFHTNVTTQELLNSFDENGNVVQGGDGFLTFVYTQEGYTLDGGEIADLIPNANFPMGDTVFYLPYSLPNNIDIDFIIIKEGTIGVLALTTEPTTGNFTLNIPELSFNNVVFNESFGIPAFPIPGNDVYNMPDYVLAPENDTMTFRYMAKRDLDGGDMLMQAVTINLENMRYGYAQGYLGNNTFSIPRDSIEVDYLDFLEQGQVTFEDPKISVVVRNSFGFPVRAKFLVLEAILDDGSTIVVGNADLSQGIDINYPALNEVGDFKETTFTVDKNNSNIQQIIGQPIRYFDYQLEALTNPEYDTTAVGFLTDSSFLELDLEVELPLYGTAKDFMLCDTFALDFSAYQELKNAELKLFVENGFPVDVFMQLYFLDDNGVLVDSLTTNPDYPVMRSGILDANGRVMATTETSTFYDLNEDRLTVLKQRGRQVVLKTSFTTAEDASRPVKFYADNTINVKLGAIAGIDP